jgi:preprotein translocase subunit SecG
MKRLSKILPHITIILAGIFWILDILNPTMNFINRKISNKLLLAFCISAIITAILAVYYQRKNDRKE